MRRVFLLLLLVVLCTASAVAALGWFRSAEPAAPDDPKLLANRIWAERAPRDERDMVLYLVPIQFGSKRSGVIQRASKYAYGGEIFAWKRDGATLVLEMPQRRQVFKLPVRTWACGANEAPKGFDLCLELGIDDEKVRLYSRKGWRVPKGEDLPGLPTALSAEALPDLDGACAACADADVHALMSLLR